MALYCMLDASPFSVVRVVGGWGKNRIKGILSLAEAIVGAMCDNRKWVKYHAIFQEGSSWKSTLPGSLTFFQALVVPVNFCF